MAKQDFSIVFSNATISLEDNEIVEFPKANKKDGVIQKHVLSEVIEKLQGEERRFTITIKESVDLEPAETEGM